MTEEILLQSMQTMLPGFTTTALYPIEKGGSSRCFYRAHSHDANSVILVRDLGEKEENKHYAALAGFLTKYGVPVPAVLAVDHSNGLLWLEDLGEADLWAYRNEPWEIRRPLYESVLRGVFLLHSIPVDHAAELHLQKEFDEHLYRWEQEYFAEHCLGGIFGISEADRDSLLETPPMRRLAAELASEPRQLVHRDFQSQNIMIREGKAWFIDFQGMRPGLPHYDLASLLCDPYVVLSAKERDYLLNFYRKMVQEEGGESGEKFDRLFWKCAAQRLMQALGAYGFLSLQCGKSAFRVHVTPALARLREALGKLHPDDRLDELASTVEHLKES